MHKLIILTYEIDTKSYKTLSDRSDKSATIISVHFQFSNFSIAYF